MVQRRDALESYCQELLEKLNGFCNNLLKVESQIESDTEDGRPNHEQLLRL